MRKYAKYGELALSSLKYGIACLTILAGISAMFTPLTALSGPLGFLYGTRVGLILFGSVVASCGLLLLHGKVSRSKRGTGRGLMACYCCFVFATLIQMAAFGYAPEFWLNNAFLALITGALWLRWRFKTEYIDPKHFKQDIIDME